MTPPSAHDASAVGRAMSGGKATMINAIPTRYVPGTMSTILNTLRTALVANVTGAPDSLQEGCDPMRGRDLANQIDVTDIDAELE